MVGPGVQRDVYSILLSCTTSQIAVCADLETRTLAQLARDEREKYPLASYATIHHFYVDDWLSGAGLKKKQLNSVSKIQTTIPLVEWCHVSAIVNPADLGTKGFLSSQLLAHDQWVQGPLWLNQCMNETPSYKIPKTFSLPDNALKEKRSVGTCVAKIVPLPEFIDRISSFTKLVRVCAWSLKFIKKPFTSLKNFWLLEIIGTSCCSCYYCASDSTNRISE
ncbi:hypothetical protein TNIN_206971 [Trichonephila inaurata madagascariensis]|uniref:Uncharacterized protein n=1 Tax=Trichonephila inaurata madagascariensis TaxID=2747483 RepID=A0A8X7CII4_9ARAC|nr:hypothetical protein TNIN_206971 [Trichonephila inaurata madagascariensis]